MTEQEEFGTIYELDIVEIPTNKPLARIDHPDVVYKNTQGKLRAIVNQIEKNMDADTIKEVWKAL